jgi:hypothetical protein
VRCSRNGRSTLGSSASAVQKATWQALAAAVPWLANLPPEHAQRLDLSELVVPSGRVARVRADVEQILNAHVMTYRRCAPTPAPGRTQLCQILACAELAPEDLALLQRAEESVAEAGVVLCAYANPLRLLSS